MLVARPAVAVAFASAAACGIGGAAVFAAWPAFFAGGSSGSTGLGRQGGWGSVAVALGESFFAAGAVGAAFGPFVGGPAAASAAAVGGDPVGCAVAACVGAPSGGKKQTLDYFITMGRPIHSLIKTFESFLEKHKAEV